MTLHSARSACIIIVSKHAKISLYNACDIIQRISSGLYMEIIASQALFTSCFEEKLVKVEVLHCLIDAYAFVKKTSILKRHKALVVWKFCEVNYKTKQWFSEF
jgi:hypothetical protein